LDIVAVAGSLRAASYNRGLLRAAAELAPADVAVEILDDRRVRMKTSGITAALPGQDLSRARQFYLEKVGLQAVQCQFLNAAMGGWVSLSEMLSISLFFIPPRRRRQGSSCRPFFRSPTLALSSKR
jgi:hypothetical protein